jgi:3-hydroxypropanoate dehydrogenase
MSCAAHAVRALGLDTGPMSGFSNEAVDAAFFADTPNIKSNFLSTLGYGDPATIFERSPRPDFDVFNRLA